jgi:hypothetical protein
MASFLIIGDKLKRNEYINSFIENESFKEYEVESYEDKILIDSAKKIIRSLALKITGKKLILLKGEITVEAQNALLKNIEELSENCIIFICANSKDDVLPTIQSRCFVINLSLSETAINSDVCSFIISYAKEKIGLWELIDKLEGSEIILGDVDQLLTQLRYVLIDFSNSQTSKYYLYCKRLLALSSLLKNNNVQAKIVFEKVFV